MSDDDPLKQLIGEDLGVEERKRLAALLIPYVSFDKDSKESYFKKAFQEVNNTDKVELILVIEKAHSLLFEEGKNEGLAQSDIIKMKIMPVGSVKTSLKRLFDSKKISKSPQGKYFIPQYRLSELFKKYSLEGKSNE